MNPFPSSIKKITALGLILLGLTLPACNASWIADPLSRYVQRTTGLDIRIQEVEWDFWALGAKFKKITLGLDQQAVKGRANIPELFIRFGWEFSEAFPFIPRLWVEQLILDSPRVTFRLFKTEGRADWREWLKKIPSVRQWEIRNGSGRVEREGSVVQFFSGDHLFRGLPARSRRSDQLPLPKRRREFRHITAVL